MGLYLKHSFNKHNIFFDTAPSGHYTKKRVNNGKR